MTEDTADEPADGSPESGDSPDSETAVGNGVSAGGRPGVDRRRTDGGSGGTDEVGTETVEHVAELARVDLEAGERERFAEQFADILGYFETLDEVPAVEREPELTNVMRPDEVADSLDREAALGNAPETEDGKFKGPRVS